ncbi:Acetamidase/formamidase [Brevibacterium sp. 239c]|uniref:acetamidase/formamidase family protein n=1 Tax=Brevibacterium sp. 239c TaxID=1965356 RepID=UPI000C3E9A54|nr:acetamidase/formamidase family protein [Brevibacterium sp. 239c]SMX67803.1 Acetamidase/formamidase [Brevibacterium sp. 239c]
MTHVASSMDVVDFVPERNQFVYTFGGSQPAATITPGTALRLWSEDAFNNAITSVADIPSEMLDARYLNPQTGPFYVEGAQPGDTLVIHIVELTPARSWGASAMIPFFGGLTATDRTSLLHDPLPEGVWIYEIDSAAQTVGFQTHKGDFELALPLEPMLGTVGVAPAGGEVHSSLTPERYGGNMDTPEMKVGTTAYFGVNVDGAMFSIGDGHYRQGEGEACGTAVEGAMNSTIIVDLIKGGGPAWPRLENDGHWMVVGSSRPMEDSWRISQVEMIRWLGELYGLETMDAYQLLTQISLVPVANVVDTNYSVVTKIAKSLLPTRSAFDGIHADLRDRARSLS